MGQLISHGRAYYVVINPGHKKSKALFVPSIKSLLALFVPSIKSLLALFVPSIKSLLALYAPRPGLKEGYPLLSPFNS